MNSAQLTTSNGINNDSILCLQCKVVLVAALLTTLPQDGGVANVPIATTIDNTLTKQRGNDDTDETIVYIDDKDKITISKQS